MATAKVTLSVKRRLENGDELFVAPGIEMQCLQEDLDATQDKVVERVNGLLTTLLEQFPDAEEEEGEEEEEAEEESEEEAEEGEEEEEITEEDIASMKAADLKALIEENELDVDPKGMKLAQLREAVTEALFDAEEEEGEEEEEEGFTEEELQEMKLADLQEIAEKWELDAPKLPKTAKLPAKKKAYIELILEAQGEVEEE